MSAPELLELSPDCTHFYRYGSAKRLDWLKPVIVTHKIYIPTARELNDPRECKPRLAKLNHAEMRRFLMTSHRERNPGVSLDELAKARGEIDWLLTTSTPEKQLDYMSNILYERTEKTRVFSMSKRWNNLSMWAKYADEHSGYCLEFARIGIFELARPVLYDDSKLLDLRNHQEEVTFAWTHYKSPEWSNEEEIRVVLPTFVTDRWCPIGPQALTRILLGKDMRQKDRKQILAWASGRTPPLIAMTVQFDRYTQELTLVPA